jgi:uncharacterized protein YlzI (FlbEa/FlbD family)
MGIFSAGLNAVKSTLNGAEKVANAGQRVAHKALTETGNTLKEGTQDVFNRSVDQVQNKVKDVTHNISTATNKVVDDGVQVAKNLHSTATNLKDNTTAVVNDVAHGHVPFASGKELVVDLAKDGVAVSKSTTELIKDSLKNLNDLGQWAVKGDSLLLGNPDGFLGVNFEGSLLGGNNGQGIIPDSRGITGSLPFKVSLNGLGIDFGGEIPLNQVLGAFLAINPYTSALAPAVSAINLGGVGVTGRVDSSGFSFKIFGVAGPSYDLGVGSFSALGESGNYTKVQLLSWNDTKLKDLPLLGDVLGHIPLIKDLEVPVAKIHIEVDSKLYAQLSASAELFGVGPKGQVEVIHDLDNDLRKLFGIAKETAETAIDEAGKLLAGTAAHSSTPTPAAPELELIGGAAATDAFALAA